MAKLTIRDRIYEWFDERYDLRKGFREIIKKPVPAFAMNPIYCFGGIAFLSFIILVISGIFLTFYYQPDPDKAYDSIMFIMKEVKFGSFVRSIHYWSANLMIAAVYLHMFRVFFTGAYKPPREFTWIVGMILLFLTLGFGFTGFLLRWDQLAYWATTIGINVLKTLPLAGPFLAKLLLGGEGISGIALTRFYIIHIIVLPVLTFLLLGIHFFLIRKQGISEPL